MFGLTNYSFSPVQNSIFNFGETLDHFFSDDSFGLTDLQTFKMDVKEENNNYIIEAEMPGINKEDIALDYRNDTLYINVQHNEEVDNSQDNYICKERRTSSMSRGIYLKDIQIDQISASLENGILKIIAPKNGYCTPHYQIEIH